MKYGRVFFFILLLGANTPLRVVFLGDSLTSGYGISMEHTYPALIGRMLEKEGYQVSILNAGVSGDTTAGGLRRIDWLLKQRPDIFFIALGANDSLRGQDPEEAKKNLSAIIDRTLEKYPQTRIILAGIKAPPSMGSDYESSFNPLYQTLAQEKQVPLIPFLLEGVAGEEALNLPDKIHPNEEGHKRIAQTVYPAIAEAIQNRAPAKP